MRRTKKGKRKGEKGKREGRKKREAKRGERKNRRERSKEKRTEKEEKNEKEQRQRRIEKEGGKKIIHLQRKGQATERGPNHREEAPPQRRDSVTGGKYQPQSGD